MEVNQMDPTIQERLDRLSELTDEEIATLEADIVAAFDAADALPRTPTNVSIMQEYSTAHDTVVGEQTSRVEANETAEELRGRMHPMETPAPAADPPPVPAADPAASADPAPAADPAPVADPPPVPLPAAAATDSPTAFNAQPNSGIPGPTSAAGLRATGRTLAMRHGTNGRQAGEEITDRNELAQLMHNAVASLGRGSGERVLVASVQYTYPEERRLTGDPVRDTEKIAAVVNPQAVVASGGICNPVAVDYSLLVQSVTDEPIGDALPNFGADRGGLRYMLPPTFTGVGSSATGIWTEAIDANPGTATKPLQTITCGQEQEVFVDAIPTRLKFGNMMARFYPEMIDANTDLAMANAARVRELYRLQKISAQSTIVSSGQLLGASRDIMATLDQAAAAYRYRSRLGDKAPLRSLFPTWCRDMFRADLARTHGISVDNTMSIPDSEINGWFTDRNVNVTWFLDGQASVTGGSGAVGSAFQGFGAQAANTKLIDWPTNMVWWLFAEGTFQRLDGGRLDLGVVRDSVLDSTNDYETFVESFETVAYRGYESLQVVSAVRPNGSYAGPVTTATSPNIY